jgi:polyisoprenoid-binding protein YceI
VKYGWIGLFLCVILGVGNAQSDRQSLIQFKIRNFGVAVAGTLSGLKGEIRFDPQHPEQAYFNVTVDVNSINTGIDLRDKHLKKEEYFDVKNYQVIRFVSSKISRGDAPDTWRITGKLLIKNTAKEISFPFYASQEEGAQFLNGEFVVNRRDFGVGGRSISLSDEVWITLRVNY